MNKPSATRITLFRPSESARMEANGETRRAKNDVHEVMMDLSRELRALPEREVPIETRVADITPVSSGSQEPVSLRTWAETHKGVWDDDADVHPNNKPLIPAEKARSHMNRPGGALLDGFPDVEAACASRSSRKSSLIGSRLGPAIRGSSALDMAPNHGKQALQDRPMRSLSVRLHAV